MNSGFQEEPVTSVSTVDRVTISLSVKKKENKGNAAATEKHAAAVESEARFVRSAGPHGNPG
jgi:hypothetical protein